jgi:hypothetical protein
MQQVRRDFLLSLASAVPLLYQSLAKALDLGSDHFELGIPDSKVTIVSRLDSPAVSVARQRLASYLTNLTGEAPLFSNTNSDARQQIILGDSSVSKHFGLPLPQNRRGSFTVGLLAKKGQSRLIVSGQADEGVKRGVYHLMQHLSLDNGKLAFQPGITESSPFFAGRGTHPGGFVTQLFGHMKDPVTFSQEPATAAQLAWNHWDHWDPERIPGYVAMLDFFGYNIIESEIDQLTPDSHASSAEIEETMKTRRSLFVNSIRHNGMGHGVHFIGTLDGGVPYGSDSKKRYDDYYNSAAQAVGPHIDWVMTHWLDAGGWKSTPEHPCTIEVLQDLHMQIDRAFKKANSKAESILGLWALDEPGFGTGNMKWDGYDGVDTILKSGLIPADVGMAMSRTYRAQEARRIVASGHKASVWGWYLDDNELVYTMHVHTHILQDYLRQVPGEARDLSDFHTLSDCQAETNLYTVYLGAHMLWNPREDPEVYLREVAKLVYGPKLESPVFHGLKAIADIRCGKECRGYWNPGYGGRNNFNGVVTFEQALVQSEEAWNDLKGVEIDKNYVAPIQFHRPVEVLLKELKGHVEAVAKYMRCLKDRQEGNAPPMEVPAADGPFEYYERIKYLHPEAIWWPATIADHSEPESAMYAGGFTSPPVPTNVGKGWNPKYSAKPSH